MMILPERYPLSPVVRFDVFRSSGNFVLVCVTHDKLGQVVEILIANLTMFPKEGDSQNHIAASE